jgi:hypothetical protein
MVWFVVWFVSLQMSASLLPDDLSIPYFGLSQQHNQQIMTIFPHNESNGQTDVDQGKCLYTTYGGKTVEEISQLISSEMVQKSLDVQGSFTRLRKNLELKLQSNLPFNILYLGGSVCVGHGCHLCKSSGNSFQVNEASFHCSWTHRLTRYVEFLIEHGTGYLDHKELSLPTLPAEQQQTSFWGLGARPHLLGLLCQRSI